MILWPREPTHLVQVGAQLLLRYWSWSPSGFNSKQQFMTLRRWGVPRLGCELQVPACAISCPILEIVSCALDNLYIVPLVGTFIWGGNRITYILVNSLEQQIFRFREHFIVTLCYCFLITADHSNKTFSAEWQNWLEKPQFNTTTILWVFNHANSLYSCDNCIWLWWNVSYGISLFAGPEPALPFKLAAKVPNAV